MLHKKGVFPTQLLEANNFEEGTCLHSVICYEGQYCAIYHGRSIVADDLPGDRRTTRICKLIVKDGIITAKQIKDSL